MQHKKKYPNDLLLYRERIGLTQQHVAELLDSRGATLLSKIEQGHRLPSLRTALKLAAIYRVPIEFLYPELYNTFRDRIRKNEVKLASSGKQPTLPLNR